MSPPPHRRHPLQPPRRRSPSGHRPQSSLPVPSRLVLRRRPPRPRPQPRPQKGQGRSPRRPASRLLGRRLLPCRRLLLLPSAPPRHRTGWSRAERPASSPISTSCAPIEGPGPARNPRLRPARRPHRPPALRPPPPAPRPTSPSRRGMPRSNQPSRRRRPAPVVLPLRARFAPLAVRPPHHRRAVRRAPTPGVPSRPRLGPPPAPGAPSRPRPAPAAARPLPDPRALPLPGVAPPPRAAAPATALPVNVPADLRRCDRARCPVPVAVPAAAPAGPAVLDARAVGAATVRSSSPRASLPTPLRTLLFPKARSSSSGGTRPRILVLS